MYKKMVSLWRYLRTPVLLTSATVFVIGCASKNPLIDEAEPAEDTEKVAITPDKTDRTADNAPVATGIRESTVTTSSKPDTLREPVETEQPRSDSMATPSPAAKTIPRNDVMREESDAMPEPVGTERTRPDNMATSSAPGKNLWQSNETPAQSGAMAEAPLMEQPRRPTVIEPMPAINEQRQNDEVLAETENDLNSKPTGLKKWLNMLSPYKLNIQQGNFVSSEMLSRVQYGMTKEQVRFILGTPLLMDIFHANRWDYLFRLQKPNGATTTNRVTIFFSGNLVDRIVSDKLPNEKEYLMHITSDDEVSEKTKKETDTEATEKKTDETSSGESAETAADSAGVTEEEQRSAPADAVEPRNEPEPSGDTGTSVQDDTDDGGSTAQTAPVTVQPTLRPSGAVRLPRATRAQQPRTAPVRGQTPSSDAAPTAQEPVALPSPEPVRTPEPVSTSEPVRAAEPSLPSSQTRRIVRPLPRPPAQADYEDEEDTSSGTLGAFEPISTPSRAGRMLPHSPNDELIGNIQ